jgi:hypothetical protein
VKPEHAIKIIMSQHWDMWACNCWICAVGRENGIYASDTLIRKREVKPYVSVDGANSDMTNESKGDK